MFGNIELSFHTPSTTLPVEGGSGRWSRVEERKRGERRRRRERRK
jgi:hypothetical protein